LKKSGLNRHHIVPDYDTEEDIIYTLLTAENLDPFYKDISEFYFLIKLVNGRKYPLNMNRANITLYIMIKLAKFDRFRPTWSVSALWMITQFLQRGGFRADSKLLNHAIFHKHGIPLPQNKQEFIDSLTGKKMNTLEMIAVILITDFAHLAVHEMIEKFDYSDFFCAGTEKFRSFLQEKAKQAKNEGCLLCSKTLL
jgi:hypothetical protein